MVRQMRIICGVIHFAVRNWRPVVRLQHGNILLDMNLYGRRRMLVAQRFRVNLQQNTQLHML